MVTRSLLILHVTFFAVLRAYPSDLERWTPEEIAAYLSEAAIMQSTSPVEDPNFDTDNQGLGMVSAVAVDSNGDVLAFHRADRPWTDDTFQNNELTSSARVPISKDTIFQFNPNTGLLIRSFGSNFFNVPHGLKIDAHDNLWLTDVGRHQVFRFAKNSSTPDLVLGEKFVPGDDDSHFCKPTDVAIASNGEFFVADGYCNSRILKYSKDGKLITKWGTKTENEDLTPFTLDIPHSVTLVEELDLVCVADRENKRALCYNAGLSINNKTGTFNRTVVPQDDVGRVFAISYNKATKEMVVAAGITQPFERDGDEIFPARAFTYDLEGEQKDAWAFITPDIARNGPSLIHGLATSNDGQDYFLADIYQQKVVKYSKFNQGLVM